MCLSPSRLRGAMVIGRDLHSAVEAFRLRQFLARYHIAMLVSSYTVILLFPPFRVHHGLLNVLTKSYLTGQAPMMRKTQSSVLVRLRMTLDVHVSNEHACAWSFQNTSQMPTGSQNHSSLKTYRSTRRASSTARPRRFDLRCCHKYRWIHR